MTTPMTPAQQAQQSNRENDGKYTTKSHSEADIGLNLTAAPMKPTLEEIMKTHMESDLNYGYDMAFKQMQAERRNVSRQTPEDEQQFRGDVGGHLRYRTIRDNAAAKAAQKAAYGRAFEQGTAIDPEDDAHFEQIWSGELKENPHHMYHSVGFSEQDVNKLLETSRKDYQWVEDGKLSPRELLGHGTSKQEALDAIQAQIDTYERGLATRGRSLGINAEAMEQMR